MTETAAKQWYIARDGKQTGPISDVEITTIAGMGYFRESDLVWRPGLAEWMPAFTQFPPKPAAPPPPAPPPAQMFAQAPGQASGPGSYAGQSAGYAPRELIEPTTGRPRAPEPLQAGPQPARTLPLQTPASQRTGAPQQAPAQNYGAPPSAAAPDPRYALDPRRETTARNAPNRTAPPPGRGDAGQRPEPKPRKSRAGAVVAVLLLLALGGGAGWLYKHPDQLQTVKSKLLLQTASLQSTETPAAPTDTATAVKTVAAEPTSADIAAMDDRLQRTAHWPVLKRVFPDWYAERVRDAARLKAEQRTDDEISKSLAEQIVALRRQNVSQALSASAPKLKALASAFLENLKQLKSQSTTTCYNFISRGETTPGVVSLLSEAKSPPPPLQLQIAAIFDAIDEGRSAPVTHQRPQKPDFDVLMSQLAKLGWTQTDVATFADPDKLARAEPDRVCQMVQDWFVAHISIPDAAVQERLLSETLRPVVAG